MWPAVAISGLLHRGRCETFEIRNLGNAVFSILGTYFHRINEEVVELKMMVGSNCRKCDQLNYISICYHCVHTILSVVLGVLCQ